MIYIPEDKYNILKSISEALLKSHIENPATPLTLKVYTDKMIKLFGDIFNLKNDYSFLSTNGDVQQWREHNIIDSHLSILSFAKRLSETKTYIPVMGNMLLKEVLDIIYNDKKYTIISSLYAAYKETDVLVETDVKINQGVYRGVLNEEIHTLITKLDYNTIFCILDLFVKVFVRIKDRDN